MLRWHACAMTRRHGAIGVFWRRWDAVLYGPYSERGAFDEAWEKLDAEGWEPHVLHVEPASPQR